MLWHHGKSFAWALLTKILQHAVVCSLMLLLGRQSGLHLLCEHAWLIGAFKLCNYMIAATT